MCAHFFRRRFQPGTWITPLPLCHESGPLLLSLSMILMLRPMRCRHRPLNIGFGRWCRRNLMLAIAGGPVLSIWKDSGSQLQLISLRVAHWLADNDDDDDEHGQQDEYAANGHCHYGTVTHFVGSVMGWRKGGRGRGGRCGPNAKCVWLVDTRVLHAGDEVAHAIRNDSRVVCGLASMLVGIYFGPFWDLAQEQGCLPNENRFTVVHWTGESLSLL